MELKTLFFGFGERGQAAVTDALFLLLIVGVLSASLFGFSSSYGESVSRYLSNQYRTDFAVSALKTMLYTSVPRDPSQSLADAVETDYLMAAVKEDFADDSSLSGETMLMLRNSSRIAMKPVSTGFDYSFVFQKTTGSTDPFFIYLYSSNIEFPGGAVCGGKGFEQRQAVLGQGTPHHSEYFCIAEDSDVFQAFLESLGSVSMAQGIMRLSELERSGFRGQRQVLAKASLFMWTATCLESRVFHALGENETLEQAEAGLESPDKPWFKKLVCKEIGGSMASLP